MTRRLEDYIRDSEQWVTNPAVGDDFAINIREECLLESHVIESSDDSIVIQGDDRFLELLEQYGMLGETQYGQPLREDAVRDFASQAHEEWRQGWIRQNGGKSVPRVKKNSDGTEGDINVPFDQLHPDWQRENLAAGKAAQDAVKQHPGDIEAAAEYIHDRWMERNPRADYNAAQHVPYDQLPEPEKEKDRVHVRTMMRLMGKPVSERIARYGAVGTNRAQGFTREDQELSEIDEAQDLRRIQKLAGLVEDQDDLAGKAAALAAVGADTAPERVTTVDEGARSSVDMDLRHIAQTQRMDALVDALRGDQFGRATAEYLHDMLDDIEAELDRRGQRDVDMETKLRMLMDRVKEISAGAELAEAEYQGRDVPLGKPMRGDVKKFKVYVRDPRTGNVKKVNFGDKTMRIKKSNPARRKSFRARHNCDNPGPRTKARYWSCRKW